MHLRATVEFFCAAKKKSIAAAVSAATAIFFAFLPLAAATASEQSVAETSVPAVAGTSESVPVRTPLPADVVAVEKFPTCRTEYFLISGESAAEAGAAARIAATVENYFIKTPRVWKSHLPPLGLRVGVELFRQPGIYRMTRNYDGRVTLFLSGDFGNEAGIRRMRTRLAEALLAQMFPDAATVPAWLCAAVAEESRIGTVPGRRIYFRKISADATPVPPAFLLSAGAEAFETDANLRLNAVWFLRASVVSPEIFFEENRRLEEKVAAAFPREMRELLLRADAADSAGTAASTETAEGTASAGASSGAATAASAASVPVAVEAIWAVRFFAAVSEAPAGIDLPEESKRRLDDALIFSVVPDGGRERRVTGGDLVAFRLNSGIRAAVSARFAELAPLFNRVNPVWHNALTEYGVFLEMFGNPDVPDETVSAQWRKAIFARSEAMVLQRDVEAALSSCDNSN